MRKIHQLTYLTIILIAFNINTFGQQFGVKASGGISRIYGELGIDNFNSFPNPTSPSSSSFSPSFQTGLYYQLPTGKYTSLGAELLFSQIQGEQTVTWEQYFNNEIVAYGTFITHENISYLSLPVYFGLTFKRLTINGGFQVSYALSSSGSFKTKAIQKPIEDDTPRPLFGNWSRDINNLPIKEVDFGPRIGGLFRLTNRLSMEGMFYYGLRNINQLKSSEEALKIQQMTVGMRYALWSRLKTQ